VASTATRAVRLGETVGRPPGLSVSTRCVSYFTQFSAPTCHDFTPSEGWCVMIRFPLQTKHDGTGSPMSPFCPRCSHCWLSGPLRRSHGTFKLL
jgi:hypothetical protein